MFPVPVPMPAMMMMAMMAVAVGVIGIGSGCASAPKNPLGDPAANGADLDMAVIDAGSAEENFAHARRLFVGTTTTTSRRNGDGSDGDVPDDLLRTALAYCRLGLERSPDAVGMHQLYQAGLYQLARRAPHYATRLVAEYRDWYDKLGRNGLSAFLYARALLIASGERNFFAAKAVLAEALQSWPNDYSLNLLMGRMAMVEAAWETAVDHLSRASVMGLPSGQFEAATLLGEALAELGHFDQAETVFRLVLENDRSAGIEVYEQLAKTLAARGQFDLAKHILLYDLPPLLAAATRCKHLRTVGEIYAMQNDWPRAALAFEQYLAFHPHASDVGHIRHHLDAARAQLAAR